MTSTPSSLRRLVRNRELVSWRYGVKSSEPIATISAFTCNSVNRRLQGHRISFIDFANRRTHPLLAVGPVHGYGHRAVECAGVVPTLYHDVVRSGRYRRGSC